MRSRFAMFAVAFGMVAAFLLTAGLAHSQSKFPNRDTAKNRQDSTWGTPSGHGDAYFGTDGNESDVWGYKPPEPEEPVDWYDKIVITANPNVNWPTNSSSSSTTSTTSSTTDGVNTTTSSSTSTTTTTTE